MHTELALVAVFTVLLFSYSLLSSRLERTIVTAPMLFTAAGIAVFFVLGHIPSWKGDRQFFLIVIELGLVLLLFTDASRTDLRTLKDIRNLPARLLSTGLLLTIVMGALAAMVIFPAFSVWEAGILGAILAPTDAGLGQVIVTSPRVPMRIRQALNVEAGLNDGLSVPFLFFFVALADSSGTASRDANLAQLVVEQLGYGTVVGAAIGAAGGWLLTYAQRRQWMALSFLQLGVVALPLLCLFASEAAAASMFIAAFVAGLAVQVGFRDAGRHSVEFAEEWGQLFNLAVFFIFGLLVARAFSEFDVHVSLYALLSLTLVRIVPVAIALVGTGLSWQTVAFMGWFGPRGLASIALVMVYLQDAPDLPGNDTIRLAVMLTVLISIFAHGLSAVPGIELYARRLAACDVHAPEHHPAA
jgi:NhaP-type Na+/H+ or K+/H+ antiporter